MTASYRQYSSYRNNWMLLGLGVYILVSSHKAMSTAAVLVRNTIVKITKFLFCSVGEKESPLHDINFEIGKPWQCFDWMLQSSSGHKSKCWQGFPISKLISEKKTSLFFLGRANTLGVARCTCITAMKNCREIIYAVHTTHVWYQSITVQYKAVTPSDFKSMLNQIMVTLA